MTRSTRSPLPSPAAVQRAADFLSPIRVRLVSCQPITRGNMRALVTVEFCGLRIHDIAVFQGHMGAGIGLPTKAMLDADGRHKRDQDGNPHYRPVVEWSTPDQAEAFSKAVVELVERAHPGALG